MKLTKTDIKAIEKLGWSVQETENGYCLENWSDAGCDMIIRGETKEYIINSCKCYDAEETFRLWYGANNGEPSNPGRLWEDCLQQGEMYDALLKVLEK